MRVLRNGGTSGLVACVQMWVFPFWGAWLEGMGNRTFGITSWRHMANCAVSPSASPHCHQLLASCKGRFGSRTLLAFTSVGRSGGLMVEQRIDRWFEYACVALADQGWHMEIETREGSCSHRECPWGGHLLRFDYKHVPVSGRAARGTGRAARGTLKGTCPSNQWGDIVFLLAQKITAGHMCHGQNSFCLLLSVLPVQLYASYTTTSHLSGSQPNVLGKP